LTGTILDGDNTKMSRPRILLPILIVLALAPIALLIPPSAAGDEAEGDADGPRVILRVDRYSIIKGHVELEDDEVIVVRRLDGTVESFVKARLTGIVRLVDPEPDQPGVVVMRDGQTREGIIIEDVFEHVLVEIEGVRTKLLRETVDHVILEPTFQQRYEHFKTTLRPDMPQRHFTLCEWLVEQRQYELARKELDELLTDHPEMPEALRLSTIVDAQLALRTRPTKRESDEPEPRDDEKLPDDLITDADVNMIRIYELDFRRPPRVVVSHETIRKLIERYGTNKLIPASKTEREALYKADAIQIVELMFNLRARELYGEIKVLSEPYALNLFRQRVHNSWLINNCATSRCHGGGDGGRLFLHRHKYTDERVRYTNLLILERLELDAEMPLLNYQAPMDSLLIQYGLPRNQARLPHPPVKGWRPAFRRPTDRMVQETIHWMEAMFRPRPEYPVEYEPPVLDPLPPETPPTGGEGGRTGR
jgi:hypothetical protein